MTTALRPHRFSSGVTWEPIPQWSCLLSDEDVYAFERDGFVVVTGVFDADRVLVGPPSPAATARPPTPSPGTARMGTDPATSVTDPFGRVHKHPGLWVMDGSPQVTIGGGNPILTMYPQAYRCLAELACG